MLESRFVWNYTILGIVGMYFYNCNLLSKS
jgi:hypothetical protein